MIRLLWAISPTIRDFLQRWMPTNRLLATIRTPRGLKWGVPAMGIGMLYFLAAASLTSAIRDGGPEWLYALVLLFIWNGFGFALIGPVSLVYLIRRAIQQRWGALDLPGTTPSFGPIREAKSNRPQAQCSQSRPAGRDNARKPVSSVPSILG